jgi:hypothetical protein
VNHIGGVRFYPDFSFPCNVIDIHRGTLPNLNHNFASLPPDP